jgi:hypothetical protein
MAKPHIHAESSARRYGGKPEDYLEIHNWFDQTKAFFPDQRHRAILHSSFGIFLCAQVFGDTITNSDGKTVSVRDIGEQHVLEDFRGKFIPTPQDYLEGMEYKEWMNNGKGDSPASHKRLEKPSIPKVEILNTPIPTPKGVVFYDGPKPKENIISPPLPEKDYRDRLLD